MLKEKIKTFLLFTLGIQYFVLGGTLNEFLNIGLVFTISGILILTIQINDRTDIINYLRTRSLETLFYMNAALFALCLVFKDGIYTKLIKGGIKNLNEQINGN